MLWFVGAYDDKFDTLYDIASNDYWMEEDCSYFGSAYQHNHIKAQLMYCKDGTRRIMVFNADKMEFCRTLDSKNDCFYLLKPVWDQ